MASTYDLQSNLNDLDAALDVWEQRDDSKAQPEVRRAANTAVDMIDAMLAELHRMRSRLIGEMRDSDDATNARVDALLSGAAGQPS